MPASWFQDVDDLVDTFYTVEQAHNYDHLTGAFNNAVASMEAYNLPLGE
jgi:hypothetical protein